EHHDRLVGLAAGRAGEDLDQARLHVDPAADLEPPLGGEITHAHRGEQLAQSPLALRLRNGGERRRRGCRRGFGRRCRRGRRSPAASQRERDPPRPRQLPARGRSPGHFSHAPDESQFWPLSFTSYPAFFGTLIVTKLLHVPPTEFVAV